MPLSDSTPPSPHSHARDSSSDENTIPTRTVAHAPENPSQLRQAHEPPQTPPTQRSTSPGASPHAEHLTHSSSHGPSGSDVYDYAQTIQRNHSDIRRNIQDNDGQDVAITTGFEGTSTDAFSPRPNTHRTYGSLDLRTPTEPPSSPLGHPGDGYFPSATPGASRTNSFDEMGNPKSHPSTTQWLAHMHGIRNPRLLYLDYYFPALKWVRQYKVSYLFGDLVAAFTMASFYIPMALSYASNLGHIPPLYGLYSFVFNPLVYAFLGTCPQMIVGPEAAGSMLTGNVVRDSIRKGKSHDDEGLLHARVAGVVTGFAGAILLVAGFARLGFLDNVLSKPFLRGFISALGIVIFIGQLITELGLDKGTTGHQEVEHGSTLEKAIFIFSNLHQVHRLTAAVSLGTFAIAMICREAKRRLQPYLKWVVFIPDRFAIVVIATVLTWRFRWNDKGLAILGDIHSATGHPFPAHFPFDFSHMKHLESALTTSFLVSLLGFFESSVAAKSLGPGPKDGIQNVALSANRELVALGTANVVGSVFMALPAFGGYGRSKVNVSTGGKTPMSNIFLSAITVLCIFFLVPYFYYIPKGVLSAMIAIVAWSLVEEAPHDLKFFWHIRAWSELFLIFLVFCATIFYSLPLGIGCGVGFSLLRVIKHSTRPRIQILGRVSGTDDQFESAEADPERLEFFEGCLIVKIPEPLTFANTGNLKTRLRRLEDYGTMAAHPALPRVRQQEHNKNIIFDVHGVTSLDGAGAQVLLEIVQSYKDKGVRIIFCRIPHQRSKVYRLFEKSGIVDVCGGPRHFVSSVQAALRLSETERVTEFFRDNPGINV